MSEARRRWDERYETEPVPSRPAAFLVDEVARYLDEPGRALDVAGGAGRNSMWLAARGWDVALVDISPRAVELARAEAARRGLRVAASVSDLTVDLLPEGPWDLVLMIHYLQRDLFPRLVESLAPGGVLAFSIATQRNLERHRRPPEAYLLEKDEAPGLVDTLEILMATEGWTDEDRHEARLIARH
jgi:2-polyprenyl-3-methyl-5-hydroxy-6-metoxy-1,4-benzoquinol methylase